MPRKVGQKVSIEVLDPVANSDSENVGEGESSGGESLFSDDGDLRPDDSDIEAEEVDDDEEDEDVQYSNAVKISTREVQEHEALRLTSLSRHRNILRPFITEKVYNNLCAAIAHKVDKEDGDSLVSQPPAMKTCVLREYQLEGLNWLVQNYNAGINCILGDEMGLGKTIQSIAFFSHCIHVRKLSGPFLVVVPLTVLFNWMIELQRFCPALQALRVHTSDIQESKRLRAQLHRKPDVVVTTYEMLKTAHMGAALKRLVYRAVFLDEGHRIRNEGTDVSRACCSIKALFKVVLTGTPLQNNLRETGVILSFLAPKIFTDLTLFEGAFDLTHKRKVSNGPNETAGKGGIIDRKLLDQAHYMLRPFLLRRLKSEVEDKLPAKLETMVECPLSSLQREITQFLLFQQRTVLTNLERRYQEVSSGQKKSWTQTEMKSLLGLLAHLRKAANHPFLFPGVEQVTLDGRPTEEIVTSSGKMVVLDKLLRKLLERGHRVVLFSQFTRTLDIICDYLDWKGYLYMRLDGGTNRVMREVNVKLFNRPQSAFQIFTLSTRAGGEGVNLATADTVILFDSDWNPQVDIQAMARVHRIGQTKTVHVYRLVTKGSVDECVVHRAQKKLFLDSVVSRGSTKKGKELDELLAEEKSAIGEEAEGVNLKQDREEKDGEAGIEVGEVEGAGDLGNLDVAETSKVFAAIKFGWNAVFSRAESTGVLEKLNEGISDSDIDVLIDRTRGSRVQKKEDTGSSTVSTSGVATVGLEGGLEGVEHGQVQTVCLTENQELSAATFDENEPLISIDHVRSSVLADMERELDRDAVALQSSEHAPTAEDDGARKEEGRGKRARISRTMEVEVPGVGRVQVMRPSASMRPSAPRMERDVLAGFRGRQRGGVSGAIMVVPGASASRRQVAGRDFDHMEVCLRCWDGGEILVCDHCPASFHLDCLGLKECPSGLFSCPLHKCHSCRRSISNASLLFRCEVCPRAYCEDCLPSEAEVLGESQMLAELKYRLPSNCCYVRCSRECAIFDYVEALQEGKASGDTGGEDMGEGVHEEATEHDVYVEHEQDSIRESGAFHKNRSGIDSKGGQQTKGRYANLPPDLQPSRMPTLTTQLDFCSLDDIRHRLRRDEQRAHCRFKSMAEIPGLDIRLFNAHNSVSFALLNIVNFIQKCHGLLGGKGSSSTGKEAETEQKDVVTTKAAITVSSVEEAINHIMQFEGVPFSAAPDCKVKVFLEAVAHMTSLSLPRSSVAQLAATLGICAPSPSKVNKRLEPKFSLLLNLKKNAIEEAIVSFLVVLSPQNLLLSTSSQPLHAVRLSLPELQSKKGDGLLVTARLLMALCEPVFDENKRFFTALVIKDEDPLTMSSWHVPPESKRKGGIGSHMSTRDRKIMYMRAVRPAARLMHHLKPSEDDVEDKKLASLLKHAYLWDLGKFDPVKAVEEAQESRLTVEQVQRLGKGESLNDVLPPRADFSYNRGLLAQTGSQEMLSTATKAVEKSFADLFPCPSLLTNELPPRAYVPEIVLPTQGTWPIDVRAARQQVLSAFTISEETHLFLVWMLTDNSLLERFDIASLAEYIEFLLAPQQAQDSLKLRKPSGWRVAVSHNVRYRAMTIINNFFVLRGLSREMKASSDAAYNNQLRLYEMAYLCLCCHESEYTDQRRLESMLPLIMQKFHAFLRHRLELRVLLVLDSLKKKASERGVVRVDSAGTRVVSSTGCSEGAGEYLESVAVEGKERLEGGSSHVVADSNPNPNPL